MVKVKYRFTDKGERTDDFSAYSIVSCPTCQKPINFILNRVTCPHCGYNKTFKIDGTWFKYLLPTVPMTDYLKIDCCGNLLWAMNIEHLNFLEAYVKSDLRERMPNINKSMASRLPQWIKSKKNRQHILKSIEKLRQRLKDNGYIPIDANTKIPNN